jgi:hypothetical protein
MDVKPWNNALRGSVPWTIPTALTAETQERQSASH